MSSMSWQELEVPAGFVNLAASLATPLEPAGVVIFVHGSGSSRMSPRNRFIAEQLYLHGYATLLFDLLTPEEEARERRSRADQLGVEVLAHRVIDVVRWCRSREALADCEVGLFGAGTGAAVAVAAAAHHPASVTSMICRGGRIDLAVEYLPKVRAATLLVVGAHDLPVLQVNRRLYGHLHCEKRLEVIPEAGHLFEEPEALQHVADVASRWFATTLAPQPVLV